MHGVTWIHLTVVIDNPLKNDVSIDSKCGINNAIEAYQFMMEHQGYNTSFEMTPRVSVNFISLDTWASRGRATNNLSHAHKMGISHRPWYDGGVMNSAISVIHQISILGLEIGWTLAH